MHRTDDDKSYFPAILRIIEKHAMPLCLYYRVWAAVTNEKRKRIFSRSAIKESIYRFFPSSYRYETIAAIHKIGILVTRYLSVVLVSHFLFKAAVFFANHWSGGWWHVVSCLSNGAKRCTWRCLCLVVVFFISQRNGRWDTCCARFLVCIDYTTYEY